MSRRETRIAQKSASERNGRRWRADIATAAARESERQRLAARLRDLRGRDDGDVRAEVAAIWSRLEVLGAP